MTVAITYVNDHFSIIATDTRISFGEDADVGYYDSILKLRSMPYPLGWCTGLGFSSYIDNFKELTTKNYIRNTDEMKNICKIACERTLAENPGKLSDIEDSAIVGSWVMNTSAGNTCVIGNICFKNSEANIEYAGDNIYGIGYPSDFSDEDKAQLITKYNLNVLQTGELNQIINTILSIFNEISMRSSAVSQICEIGIQLKNGLRKLSLSGNIEELLKQKKFFVDPVDI